MSLNNPSHPQPDQSESSHPSPPHDRTTEETAQTQAQAQDPPIPITSPHADEPSAENDTAQPFQPFFTLIEDTQTGEYHHPTVHYIFSDDDTDIVTAAALRSLAQSDTKKEHSHSHSQHEDQDQGSSLLPPPIPGVRENYIVLDVESVPTETPPAPASNTLSTSPGQQSLTPNTSQNQFRVTSAQSFSPAWQVLHSEMVPAPTFENSEAAETAGHGLMLKIQGSGGLLPTAEAGKGQGAQRLEEMMDTFAKRMAELQTVIDGMGEEEQGAEAATAEETAGEHAEGPEPEEQDQKDAEPAEEHQEQKEEHVEEYNGP